MQKKSRNSSPKIDLTEQKFGRWTAKYYIKPGKWHCICDCGTEKDVEGRNLRGGKTLSCGCLQKERTSQSNSKDYTNMVFGKLTTLERIRENNTTYYLCKCNCGNPNLIKVDGRNLTSGHTTSCGCIKSKGETAIATFLTLNNIIFEKEKTFDSCILSSGNKARFDFYLPKYNLLIEYDGEQHSIISNWNTKEKLLNTQKRDEEKNEWCKKNNIKLLRIKYDEFNNIDKILGGELFGRIE